MDWLVNISVDAMVAIFVVVVAGVLSINHRKPVTAATPSRAVARKKLSRVVQSGTSARRILSVDFGVLPSIRSAVVFIATVGWMLWPYHWYRSRKPIGEVLGFDAKPLAHLASRPSSELLSNEAQWARVTGIVSRAIEGAGSVERWQRTAEEQLDAAAYAITGLLDELGPVMPHVFGEHHKLQLVPALAPRTHGRKRDHDRTFAPSSTGNNTPATATAAAA